MSEPVAPGVPPMGTDPADELVVRRHRGHNSETPPNLVMPQRSMGTSQLPSNSDGLAPPPEDMPRVRRGRRRKASARRNAIEWVLVIVGAILVAVVVRTLLVQAFEIPSASMYPTLEEGDRVAVNKLSYKLHDVNRGDVVVFDRPASLPANPGDPEDLIKRVIGLPGDTLFTKDGSVFVNDRKLSEPYLPEGVTTNNIDAPIKVPDDEVFVMGDNRGDSTDSRIFGPIAQDTIVGRAFMRIWPINRIGSL